jgi:hypothetical protein
MADQIANILFVPSIGIGLNLDGAGNFVGMAIVSPLMIIWLKE